MARHRLRDRQRRPARGPARKSPKRRLLVVCEGQVTEPAYIKGYVHSARNATVEVKIHDEHGDPRKLVEMAKDEDKKARALARQQKDDFLAYDEVWSVFDCDQHERFNDACQMARDNRIELAVSNPCFELWLLLHFRDSPGAQHRHRVQKMVKRFLRGYDKHLEFERVARGIEQAIARARRLDADAESMGEPFRNPTTCVYRLLESISRESSQDPAVPVDDTRKAAKDSRRGTRKPRR